MLYTVGWHFPTPLAKWAPLGKTSACGARWWVTGKERCAERLSKAKEGGSLESWQVASTSPAIHHLYSSPRRPADLSSPLVLVYNLSSIVSTVPTCSAVCVLNSNKKFNKHISWRELVIISWTVSKAGEHTLFVHKWKSQRTIYGIVLSCLIPGKRHPVAVKRLRLLETSSALQNWVTAALDRND